MTNSSRIAFIGGGNMARSLIGALLRGSTAAGTITVAEPNADLRAQLVDDFGIAAFTDGTEAARDADIVVLSVKPQVMRKVCEALAETLTPRRPLIVSIAAGIRIEQIDAWLGGGYPIVRCMPNTPALIGAGATGLIANTLVSPGEREQATAILGAAGSTVWIEREELMDTVTALSGSGPAYFFLLIEALEEAAAAQGLPRETARALAIQTCLGAARMAAEDGEAPARLRERVTSPGGTTQAALQTFADGGFRELVTQAVAAATARGRELSNQLG
jgi:pyrroline-5-carboxylate reductase